MKKSITQLLSMVLVLSMLLSLAACTTPNVDNPSTNPSTNDPTGQTDPSQPQDPTVSQDDYPEIPDGHNQLVIYWNYSGDLSTAAFWIWPKDGAGQGYPVEACDYGCRVVVNIPKSVSSVGFIACYGCSSTSGSSWIGGTKDVEQDRFIEMTGERVVAYSRAEMRKFIIAMTEDPWKWLRKSIPPV